MSDLPATSPTSPTDPGGTAGPGSATGPEPASGHLFFQGDHRLEGMLEWPEGAAGAQPGGAPSGATSRSPGGDADAGAVAGGVVIAHPHPLNGGTMAAPVVYRIAQACRRRRLVTLRFNFRGVGESEGTYNGTEEHRDVEAALAFLRGRLAALDGDPMPGPSMLPLALVGYSFGSIMAARAAAGPVPIQALVLVGFLASVRRLPMGELPLDTNARLAAFRGPVFALCAENDDLGYPDEVRRVLRNLGLDFTMGVVEDTDHFFDGRQREVGERVAAFLAETLGPERRAVQE